MSTASLRMQHSSLQFSDTPKQQEHDVNAIFEKGVNWPVKTGTEAGSDNANYALVREYADKFDHVVSIGYGNWVAVDRRIIIPGTMEREKVWVADNDEVVGRMHHRVMMTISFDHVDRGIGRVSVGAAHYPTKGRTPDDPNNDINKRYAKKIGRWMADVGRGNALAFVNGDFNMLDGVKSQDWAFGGNFTSMADELNAHQDTGHGAIDGFCSYDKDGRVSAKRFRVLDDSELKLHTDHYLCRGVWNIERLKAA